MNQKVQVYKSKHADIELSDGMFVIRYFKGTMIDLLCVKRTEIYRQSISNELDYPVLHLIPSDSPLVEREALLWLGSKESMEGVVARAVVVPSTIMVLIDKIRWRFSKPNVCYRVFKNPDLAKGWLIDVWYDKKANFDELFEEAGL